MELELSLPSSVPVPSKLESVPELGTFSSVTQHHWLQPRQQKHFVICQQVSIFVQAFFGHIEKNSRWIRKKNSRFFSQNSSKFVKEEHFRICIVKTNFFSQWALWTKSSSETPRNPKKVTGESAKKSSGLPSVH